METTYDKYTIRLLNGSGRLDEAIRAFVCEELSRSDVRSIVDSEFRQLLNNKEFKRKVKEITTDVLEELYRTLYQRKSMWKSSVTANA